MTILDNVGKMVSGQNRQNTLPRKTVDNHVPRCCRGPKTRNFHLCFRCLGERKREARAGERGRGRSENREEERIEKRRGMGREGEERERQGEREERWSKKKILLQSLPTHQGSEFFINDKDQQCLRSQSNIIGQPSLEKCGNTFLFPGTEGAIQGVAIDDGPFFSGVPPS